MHNLNTYVWSVAYSSGVQNKISKSFKSCSSCFAKLRNVVQQECWIEHISNALWKFDANFRVPPEAVSLLEKGVSFSFTPTSNTVIVIKAVKHFRGILDAPEGTIWDKTKSEMHNNPLKVKGKWYGSRHIPRLCTRTSTVKHVRTHWNQDKTKLEHRTKTSDEQT